MFDMFKTLTTLDVVYAAVLALFLTQIIINGAALSKKLAKRKSPKADLTEVEKMDAIKKCGALFPFETINFRGKVFTKGAYVRITTFQKRIIEGEIIGRNEMNILCVMTGHHIIAHEIDKIEDITEVASPKESIKI